MYKVTIVRKYKKKKKKTLKRTLKYNIYLINCLQKKNKTYAG